MGAAKFRNRSCNPDQAVFGMFVIIKLVLDIFSMCTKFGMFVIIKLVLDIFSMCTKFED